MTEAGRYLLRQLIKDKPKLLIQDWFNNGQSQVRFELAIKEVLDKDLDETYEKDMFKENSSNLYNLVYEYASKGLKWVANTLLFKQLQKSNHSRSSPGSTIN